MFINHQSYYIFKLYKFTYSVGLFRVVGVLRSCAKIVHNFIYFYNYVYILMETNDKETFTEKFIRTFPTRTFIISFVISAIILYGIAPYLRNMDYESMPVTQYDWGELPIHEFSPDKTKVVVIDGFVSGNGRYVNTVPLKYDNVNCYPANGNHRMAGYWTIEYFNISTFNAIWIVGGC